MSHLRRGEISEDVPVHATLRIEEGLPDLRDFGVYEVFWSAFETARERAGRKVDGWFRLVHYSIQGNHVHLIVEASDRDALSRGMSRVRHALRSAEVGVPIPASTSFHGEAPQFRHMLHSARRGAPSS